MSTKTHKHSILLSIVMVVEGWSDRVSQIVEEVATGVADIVSDYEIILVDSGSGPDAEHVYRQITGPGGQPNVQVFRLLNRVHYEVAAWAGVENSLGDFILVIEPFSEDLQLLDRALEEATKNAVDLVLLVNKAPRLQGRLRSMLRFLYCLLFHVASGVNLQVEAAQYRLISKRVVSYLLQQPNPASLYRTLPATAGFSRRVLRYMAPRRPNPGQNLLIDIRRGVRLLISNSVAPLRFASFLSLIGTGMNVLYSLYVVFLAITRSNLQPGWITLSLQQSGMFLLFSILAFVLTEYFVSGIRSQRSGTSYFVAEEFNSSVLTRRQRLNVEAPGATRRPDPPPSDTRMLGG